MAYQSLMDAAQNGWEVERQYLCQAHGDRTPSASLNASGMYFCYACGDKGRLDMDRIQVTPEGVRRMVDSVREKLYPTRTVYSERWLDIFDSDGPGEYWLSRYNAETCAFYRLGRTSERSVYPLRGLEGEVLGVVYRNQHAQPKYQYPRGVRIGDLLFDIHRLSSPDLVLTEGATDAIACYEAGKHVATSSYRNGLTKAQVSLIKKYDPRVLWVAYDMDKGGTAGFESIKDKLDGVFVKRLEWDGGKDLSDLSIEDRKEVLAPVLCSG